MAIVPRQHETSPRTTAGACFAFTLDMGHAVKMVDTIVLVRHGETEWSRNGRHTSTTDLPLTAAGYQQAQALTSPLRQWSFTAVVSSPRRRALDTAAIALDSPVTTVWNDLVEWDYGDYEGVTTPDIQTTQPDWYLWTDGAPGGESPADVERRTDAVVAKLQDLTGAVAVFSHGHFLRALTARWIELPLITGGRLPLATGTISVLGHEHDRRALHRWSCG